MNAPGLPGPRRVIRQAYVDVFSAVTGGKLIILTTDELRAALGEPVGSVGVIILAANEAMTNAVKHAGRGLYQVFKQSKTTQVLVSDTGAGIDFAILPKATLL